MDHTCVRILSTEPSSVILSHTKVISKVEKLCPKSAEMS